MPGGHDQSSDQPDDQTHARPIYRPPTQEQVPLGRPAAEQGALQPEQQQLPPWATAAQGYPGHYDSGPQPHYTYPPSQSIQSPMPPYGAPQGYPPPQRPGYGAAAASEPTAHRTPGTALLGRAVAVLGLGTLGAGLFALPLATYPHFQSSTYFGTVRDFLRIVPDRSASRFYNALARFWWNWGLLLAAGLLVVLVAVAVVVPAVRMMGVLITLAALATGAVQAFALAGSADLREAVVLFRKNNSMYEHAAIGIWVGFAGLGVLVLAGLLLGLSRRRT